VFACLVVVTLGALSACSSTPSNRRVVSDVIESLAAPDITVIDETQEGCMLERLELYTDDELDAIAEENETWDPAGGSTLEEASPAMRKFIADFEECTGELAAVDQPTGTSEPAGTSEPTATSAAPEATEAATSTTPSETTEG
jgi:hypothetical protein